MESESIILAHGIARWDEPFWAFRKLTGFDHGPRYFNGIRDYLRDRGFDAHETHVPFAAAVNDRARRLREAIREIAPDENRRLHIIGHSMGGLDARHMLVDFDDMAKRVASLTTIATPHNGSPLADELFGARGMKIVDALKPILNLEGFHDLKVESCAEFNERAAASESTNGVQYVTVTAHEPERKNVFPILRMSWDFLTEHAGLNDGLVAVPSQEWNPARVTIRKRAFPFAADHLNELGWWPEEFFNADRTRSVRAFYEELARDVTST